jgi:hypothetical protein
MKKYVLAFFLAAPTLWLPPSFCGAQNIPATESQLFNLISSAVSDPGRELTLWGAANYYTYSPKFLDSWGGSFGLEIAIRPGKNVDLGLGVQRLGRGGLDPYDPTNGKTAQWFVPVSGVYLGPRFDFGDAYGYLFGSLNGLADFLTFQASDKISIDNKDYAVSSIAPGIEVGIGYSFYLNGSKTLSLDLDGSAQYLEFNDISIAGILPQNFNPARNLSYSGLNATINLTFYPSDFLPAEQARKKLSDNKVDISDKAFIDCVNNHDSAAVSWFLAAGMREKAYFRNKLKANNINFDCETFKTWVQKASIENKKTYVDNDNSPFNGSYRALDVLRWFLWAGITEQCETAQKLLEGSGETKEIFNHYKELLEKREKREGAEDPS